MSRPSTPSRRSFVLISVLVIVGSALLIATSMVFMAHAEIAGLRSSELGIRSRALAWSGAQAVSVRLDAQRDRILRGDLPQLDGQYTIYEADGRAGVVRLLPVTPGGEVLAAEAGRLDINRADADVLVATGWVDETLAAEIVEHRDSVLGRPFQSVAELLQVRGVTPELLYGPLEEIRPTDDASGAEAGITERVRTRLSGEELRGLADLFTVYAFEPALQRSGDLRISLNVPWSDELGRRVDRRFGQGAAGLLKPIFDRGTTFDGEAVLFGLLVEFNSPPADWPDIVDTLTAEAGDFHYGRLDINTASYEALAALPGLDADQAAQIVSVRGKLDDETRSTIAWPAIEGIVEPEGYEQLAGTITTRSWTYRIRMAAGEVDLDDPEGALDHPLIYEAVIDLTSPRARVAYLRDITMLQTALAIALSAPQRELDEYDEDEYDETDQPTDDTAGDDDPPTTSDAVPAADPDADPDDVAGPEDMAGPDDGDPDSDGMPPGAPDSSPNSNSSPSPSPSPVSPPPAPAVADERIGRWKPGEASPGP